jgi:hypothetical protein
MRELSKGDEVGLVSINLDKWYVYRVFDFGFVHNPMNSSDQIYMFQLHSDLQITGSRLIQGGIIVKMKVNTPAMNLMIYHKCKKAQETHMASLSEPPIGKNSPHSSCQMSNILQSKMLRFPSILF